MTDEHYSNSSLNTFLTCMKRYELECIQQLPPDVENIDLQFGALSHKILQQINDDIFVTRDLVEYHERSGNDWRTDIRERLYKYIPQEGEYIEFKEKYGINSYEEYYTSAVIQILKYIRKEMDDIYSDAIPARIEIHNEQEFIINPNDIYSRYDLKKSLKGIIDCLILYIPEDTSLPSRATILDYKFSNTRKTQSDFDENSQLQIYAQYVYSAYNIAWSDMRIGYIDIPKASFDKPVILKNGTLSKAKSQNVSAEMYIAAIKEIHGDNDVYYNAGPGGFYEDIVKELSLKKAAYATILPLDIDVHENIMTDILYTMKLIDSMEDTMMPMPRKYSSYNCSNCAYKKTCKPWLTVEMNMEE